MRYVVGCATVVAAILSVFPAFSAGATQPEFLQSESPRRYTHHPASPVAPRIVPLSIEGEFTPGQRAKLLRAVEEWNHVLNGLVRLDIVTAGSVRGIWSIRAEPGGTPQAPDPSAGQPLSSTTAGFLSSGGQMLVYVDRLGTRDLRGIVLHEFGHVLGLGHDPNGNLMSARYSPTIEQCIDKPTAQMIATRHQLPLASLNWCEAGTAASP